MPNLEEILRQVLETLQPYEQEVHDQEGRQPHVARASLPDGADNRIGSAVSQMLDANRYPASSKR